MQKEMNFTEQINEKIKKQYKLGNKNIKTYADLLEGNDCIDNKYK